MEEKIANRRLQSLDIIRGITIAGMILVNNPGSWGHIFAPLKHAEWNGLTPTDLVFPFFMFIMGVSTYFSLRKFNFALSAQLWVKIVRRAVVLFLIGWAVHWLSHFCYSLAAGSTLGEAADCWSTMRYLGVLQRLGITYFLAAVLVCTMPFKRLPWLVGALLVAYSLMLLLGNGYDISLNNIIYRIDNAVLTPTHMYHAGVWSEVNEELTMTQGYGSQGTLRAAFDPEGLCSTLPSVAHVLIGVLFGHMIVSVKDNYERVRQLLLASTLMMMVGWLLSYAMPLNKNLWSPTYVLMTCGMAAALLGVLIWVIDIKGHKKWCKFFESFGVNPLFMYLMGSVLSILFGSIKLPIGAEPVSIHNLIYKNLWLNLVGEGCIDLASCLYAVTLVCIVWCIGYVLYKKKIYIKI
ncbi:MAG: acyltransferase family protein [Muribaculaceae bacterium]